MKKIFQFPLYLMLLCLFSLQVSAQSAEDLYKSGNDKMLHLDYTGAEQDFSKAIEMNPNYAEAFLARGKVQFEQKACECGTNDFDKAISLKPDYADAYAGRAIIYNCMNDTNKAMADINKALSLDKNNALAWMAMSYTDIQKEQFRKGLDDINYAQKLNPSVVKDRVYYYRGMAYLGLYRFDKAKSNFDKALRDNPSQRDIYLARSDAWIYRSRPKKAIADLDMYLRFDPDNEAVHFTKALVLLDMHNFDASVTEFGKCIAINPNHSDYYLARGLAYAKDKNYASAYTDFQRADSMPSTKGIDTVAAGRIFAVPYLGTITGKVCRECMKSGNNIAFYNNVITLDRDYKAEAYFYKCVALKKTGIEAGACEDCQRAKDWGYKNASRFTPKNCKAPATAVGLSSK